MRRITDRDATDALERRHLRQLFAVEGPGQCAGRQDPGLPQFAGEAMDQFDDGGT